MEPTATLGAQLYAFVSLFDPFCGPVGVLNLLPEGSLLSCGDTGWGDEVARGFFVTITLALCTLPIGLIIGLFLALAKQTEIRSLRAAADIYTTIFRGLPELLTIFMIYFGLQIAVREVAIALGFERGFDINSFVAGTIALSLVFSAYASEVLSSAFKAIPKGQYEGAHALGLRPGKTMRLVILPQLVRIALPGLGNLWMILIKDTALISVIGLGDTLRQTGIAAKVTKEAFFFYSIACLLFLALAMASSVVFSKIETRVRRSGVSR
ncbi:amino acid ABC transporter membrane protein 1 (PAAT family) [Hoeflea halophila]|uniref:Amino acid ABC transporter membrane protein 1 (PAAT family) n=1 Tax=Hoeflea halophila TaxID=714899 RepID=A0A286HMF2_9HYPH|nr:ABC transporter permease [Hoeflea halophila]SOE08656.1 amino acid ABC transporter membrane protein 1 (PAAT family) [Hoeflea halophila]